MIKIEGGLQHCSIQAVQIHRAHALLQENGHLRTSNPVTRL